MEENIRVVSLVAAKIATWIENELNKQTKVEISTDREAAKVYIQNSGISIGVTQGLLLIEAGIAPLNHTKDEYELIMRANSNVVAQAGNIT